MAGGDNAHNVQYSSILMSGMYGNQSIDNQHNTATTPHHTTAQHTNTIPYQQRRWR